MINMNFDKMLDLISGGLDYAYEESEELFAPIEEAEAVLYSLVTHLRSQGITSLKDLLEK